jgi:hypothetical protein
VTAPLAEEFPLPSGADAASLARDMVEVHGREAVTIGGHNAQAALASSPQQAKSYKAEELLARRKQKDDERLFNQSKDRQIQNEKTARLRGLRLAHEAVEKDKGPSRNPIST